jgi:hypothetical protein
LSADNTTTNPAPALSKFLGLTLIRGARKHLRNELKAEHEVDLIPSTAFANSPHARVFIWDQPDLLSHISFFFEAIWTTLAHQAKSPCNFNSSLKAPVSQALKLASLSNKLIILPLILTVYMPLPLASMA